MKKARGFTLIELLVAVVIVAILASIAIPSYREYVIRSNRRAAQAAMMEIATRQQQYFVTNRVYAESIGELGYQLPPEISDKYSAVLEATDGPPPSFLITATPVDPGPQAGDGDLTLDSNGVKGPADKWKR